MSENNNILQNLFRAGLTREQFIDQYTEMTQKEENKSSSIFKSDMSMSIGEIYDSINSDGNDTLDEAEISALSNLDTTDGENVLSESDLKILYDKTVKNISEKYKTDDPEKMYNTAVTDGNQDPDDYLKSISVQMDMVKELMSARRSEGEAKVNSYQSQIDDLVMRSTKLSNTFKKEYKDISDEIKKSNKEAADYEQKMKEKEQEMSDNRTEVKLINAEINDLDSEKDSDKIEKKQSELKSLDAAYSDMQAEYNNLSSKKAAAVSSASQNSDKQKSMTGTAQATDTSLKSRVTEIQARMELEKTSIKSDIESYQQQLNVLYSAQQYALSQITPVQDENDVSENYSDSDTVNGSKNAAELKKKWSKAAPWLTDGFYNKAVEVSNRLGCSPDDLMGVMYSESGLKPTAGNKNGGAAGLIQFMPRTAKILGTSTSAIKNMSAEEQLVYVEKCIASSKKMAGFSSSDKLDTGTLYSLVFLPAFAKRDVLATKGSAYYNYNSGLDLNKDGKITKQDLAHRIRKKISEATA